MFRNSKTILLSRNASLPQNFQRNAVGIFLLNTAKKVRKPTLLRNSKTILFALNAPLSQNFQRSAKVYIFLFSRTKRTLPFLLRNSNLSSCLATPCLHISFNAKLTYSCSATRAFAYFFKVGRFKGSGENRNSPASFGDF